MAGHHRHTSKDRRRFNPMREHFSYHHIGMSGSEDFDYQEEQYWAGLKGFMASSRAHRRNDIVGFSRKDLEKLLTELKPELRHKSLDIINLLEKIKILEPIDYYCDLTCPEKAVDIFTTDIPEVLDDVLSIDQISKWLLDDVKKIIPPLQKGSAGDKDREEAIDWAKYVASTYRRGLKALRRKVKAELEERELKKEVLFYEGTGLDATIEDFFEEEEDQGLINALEMSGIRYLFQLILKSKSEVKKFSGIGSIRFEKIEQKLKEQGFEFMGKEPEKKKKTKTDKKENPLEAQIVKL